MNAHFQYLTAPLNVFSVLLLSLICNQYYFVGPDVESKYQNNAVFQ